ncbi:MAG TPA: twin transmembrane helix small protein [Rhodospirillaceae bacterium]|nr:twin transmembrane helix small protein [Rhodospirillaceae bacterium]
MSIVLILVVLTVISVVAVLLLGILSMLKGGEINQKYGNKLMIARVALQALSVLLLMTLWIASSHS